MEQLLNWVAKLHKTFVASGYYKIILEGLGNAIVITIGALVIGVAIGVLIAAVKYLAEDNRVFKPFAKFCDIYVTAIRGIPMVVLLLIFYLLILRSCTNGVLVATITFGINSGAYMAELIRSGINAVDKGQTEAGRSLGLSRLETMRMIILPQAVRYVLPAVGKKESIADTARVLGRMYDGIEYRGFAQTIVEDLAKFAGVPVWNGLTNEFHPTQILADFLTIQEHFGSLKGRKLVYCGDARYNMGNSLMVGCAKMGMHFVACTSEEYFPNEALIETCQKIAAETGALLEFNSDPMAATKGADVIYTDVWVSMGEPDSVWEQRIEALKPYQVNKAMMENAGPQCRFMHCLPAFHDLNTVIGRQIHEKFGLTAMGVTDEVFESEQFIVFDEAENRMHTIKAVMAATLLK